MHMKFNLFFLFLSLVNLPFAQKTFKTNESSLKIFVDGVMVNDNWSLDPSINLDIFEVEMKGKTAFVEYKDNLNFIGFKLKKGQKIDFIVIDKNNQRANQRVIGIEPNVKFSKAYINENQGKTIVEIPEVSELVNIIMVLHKDAEKEENMFDTKSDYYKKVKTYFEPYRNHPIIDTIQKFISDLKYEEGYDAYMFPLSSYWYYYAAKMNACAYTFDKNGTIVNNGVVKEIAKGYNSFDPMKDLKLIQDFANKSNFRNFYEDNKPYYNELLKTYNQLNPVQKMQNWLDKKFGFGYGSYLIFFSPLIGGAHSTTRFEDNGFNQTFMFIAGAELDPEYSLVMNQLFASQVVFTEIDHNYVNPLSNKYHREIDTIFYKREIWAGGKQTEAYPTPYKVFNEYMTYGVYSLYLLDSFSKENVESYLPNLERMMQENRGFQKFGDFNQELMRLYALNQNQSIENLIEKMLDWCSKQNIE
jgi:hypothetical protein